MPDPARGIVLFVKGAGRHQGHVAALRKAGYQVDLAASALSALESRRSSMPDAIIVPLLMPEMTGILAHRFRGGSGKPVVLILTPDATPLAAGEEPLPAGATLCPMPCAPADLVAAVEKLLMVGPC